MSNAHLKFHVAQIEPFFCTSDNITYIHQLPEAKQLGLFISIPLKLL